MHLSNRLRLCSWTIGKRNGRLNSFPISFYFKGNVTNNDWILLVMKLMQRAVHQYKHLMQDFSTIDPFETSSKRYSNRQSFYQVQSIYELWNDKNSNLKCDSITNSPRKVHRLTSLGVKVDGTIPIGRSKSDTIQSSLFRNKARENGTYELW